MSGESGKATRVDGEVSYPSRIKEQATPVAPEPGKSTLVKPAGKQTGNDFADHGTGCESGEATTCFLEAGTRARVVGLYQGRVNAALSTYLAALTAAGVKKLLEEEKGADWVFEIMLDVVGLLTSTAALKIFRALRGGSAASDIAGDAIKKELQAADEARFSGIVGIGVGAARRAIPPPKADAGSDKAQAVSYIDSLKDQAGVLYERLREDMIAGVDDATLVVLFESFAASSHTVGAYKEQIERKLARFAKSGVGKIGVADNKDFRTHIGSGMDNFPFHESMVQWVRTPAGRRLAMYKRGTMGDGVYAKAAPKPEQDYNFQGYVPDEFVSAAVAIYTERYGQPPIERPLWAGGAGFHETLQMGDRGKTDEDKP